MKAKPMTLLEHVESARKAYPGKLLLFKIGDFWEAFGKDAEYMANTVGLTITKRMDVSMAGFPYHQLHNYVAKLEASGFHVATMTREVEFGIESPKAFRFLPADER